MLIFLLFFIPVEILKYGKIEDNKLFKLKQKVELKTDALAQIVVEILLLPVRVLNPDRVIKDGNE